MTYSELPIGTPHPLAHGGLPRSRLVGILCFPAYGLRSLITAYFELADGLRDTFSFRSMPYDAGHVSAQVLHFSYLAPRLTPRSHSARFALASRALRVERSLPAVSTAQVV